MIPLSTDAPIYHPPFGTGGLIAVNVLCFVMFCITPVEVPLESLEVLEETSTWVERLSLEFGAFKPWQWLTNNFMHADWVHLISNMVFLWSFGLIVEGKVGLLRFLTIYLAVGTIYGLILQIGSYVLPWEGYALGASAAIFGLLAFCVAWAPANEFEVLWLFGGRGGTFEISVLAFGAFFFAKEAFVFSLGGFQMSSELLHILGFVIAMPLALWMVKSGRVDCEGWDVFSYLSGTTGKNSKIAKNQQAMEMARERAAMARQDLRNRPGAPGKTPVTLSPTQRASQLRAQVKSAIDAGEFELAAKLQEKIALANPGVTWSQEDLYLTIHGLLKQRRYDIAIPLMTLHIESFESHRFAMQKLLLRIWLKEQRPRKALSYLRGLDTIAYQPTEIAEFQSLADHAKKMIDEGVIEFSN